MRSPSFTHTRALARFALAVLAFVALAAIGAGCSRSTLQGELGEIGQSCANQACPAGTTCDPTTLRCVAEDGGTNDAATRDACTANVGADPNNCGGCGIVCATGSFCENGVCTPPSMSCSASLCSNGEVCCTGGCTDVTSDPDNCGGCSVQCPEGWSCANGACQEPAQSCTTAGCSFGQTCCGATCVDPTSDPDNCGGCGLACNTSAGQSCLQGQCCVVTPGGTSCSNPTCNCAVGETCCGTEGCVMTSRDPDNCGTCGNVCAGSSCVSGVCAGTCQGAMCGSGESCCASGCSTVLTDPNNCGGCGAVCNQGQSCVSGKCVNECGSGAATCAPGQTCCTNGCTTVQTDPLNCGGCNIQCGATAQCIDGSCVADEGAFDPMVDPTYLSPGVHNFTTITVPAGVTVYVAGAGAQSGTLDLHATGAIEIDGTIDVSGGPGTQNTITSQSTQSGRAGGGGFTGEPYATAALSAACQFVAGNPGQLGFAVSGSSGTCTVGSTTVCDTINDPSSEVFAAPPAEYGGGAGVFTGFRAYGSGGGGPGGGGPGSAGQAYPGESDCSDVTGGGGATQGGGGTGGGVPYDGTAGVLGQTQCTGMGVPAAYVGGGGGGSIGPEAAADLAVTTTFQTGSGGGGASADYLNRPVFGGTSGGGGGGGALRLETPATITVTGQLFANGGAGGDAVIGTPAPNCDPQPGAGGGGGSGGVIYLSAPSITVTSAATVSAQGGVGGAESEFATGGAGGAGGLGRIRLSVTPTSCALAGQLIPPLAAGCSASSQAGTAYVAAYPN